MRRVPWGAPRDSRRGLRGPACLRAGVRGRPSPLLLVSASSPIYLLACPEPLPARLHRLALGHAPVSAVRRRVTATARGPGPGTRPDRTRIPPAHAGDAGPPRQVSGGEDGRVGIWRLSPAHGSERFLSLQSGDAGCDSGSLARPTPTALACLPVCLPDILSTRLSGDAGCDSGSLACDCRLPQAVCPRHSHSPPPAPTPLSCGRLRANSSTGWLAAGLAAWQFLSVCLSGSLSACVCVSLSVAVCL